MACIKHLILHRLTNKIHLTAAFPLLAHFLQQLNNFRYCVTNYWSALLNMVIFSINLCHIAAYSINYSADIFKYRVQIYVAWSHTTNWRPCCNSNFTWHLLFILFNVCKKQQWSRNISECATHEIHFTMTRFKLWKLKFASLPFYFVISPS